MGMEAIQLAASVLYLTGAAALALLLMVIAAGVLASLVIGSLQYEIDEQRGLPRDGEAARTPAGRD